MRKIFILLVSLFLILPPASFAGDPDTIKPVPSSNASFLSDLQTFLREEDAGRFAEQFTSFVVSGGTHGTAAGLTGTPTALIAYPNGGRVTESGSIVYPDNDTCWIIASRPTTGNLGTYTRVSGTHYLIDCASATKPTLPTGTVQLMEVTTSGGAITTVVDLRVLSPIGASSTFTLINGTGGSLVVGDVVTVSTSANSNVVLADTLGTLKPLLISLDAPANGAAGRFQFGGIVSTVKNQGAVTRGNFLQKSATTRALQDMNIAFGNTAGWPSNAVAIALVSATGSGTISALMLPSASFSVPPSYTRAGLPAAGTAGRLARVTDDIRGVWRDTGTQWTSVTGYADIRDFGAVGDGVTDDLAAFNAALATGGKVWLGAGNYAVSGVIIMPNFTTMQGIHRVTTITVLPGAAGAIELASGNVLSGIQIRPAVGAETKTGLFVGTASGVLSSTSRVYDMDIRNFNGVGGKGVHIRTAVETLYENILVSNNEINVLSNDANVTTTQTFISSRFLSATKKGVKILEGIAFVFLQCTFESNQEEGLYISNVDGDVRSIRVLSSWFEDNWASLSGAAREAQFSVTVVSGGVGSLFSIALENNQFDSGSGRSRAIHLTSVAGAVLNNNYHTTTGIVGNVTADGTTSGSLLGHWRGDVSLYNDVVVASTADFRIVRGSIGDPRLTPGSATGLTVNDLGSPRTQVYKVSLAKEAFAAASTNNDVTIATLPAGTIVHSVVARVTTAFICGSVCTTATLNATLGISAGGTEFLVSFDLDAAIDTFGDANAEMGSALSIAGQFNSGYVSSFTGTTPVILRGVSGTGNWGNGSATNLSAGALSIWILATVMGP